MPLSSESFCPSKRLSNDIILGMKKLILIDGFAILHRAYHALPPLKSKDGVLTNAVYGFFSMFLKLQNDIRPDYIVVCFDRPKPTFRQELYVGYQAQRPAMESDLSSSGGRKQNDIVVFPRLTKISIELRSTRICTGNTSSTNSMLAVLPRH